MVVHSMRLALPAWASAMFLACVASAWASPAIVLHAEPMGINPTCAHPVLNGLDCDGQAPSAEVGASQLYYVYVYVNGAEDLTGAQLAFDLGEGWSILGWIGGCLSNEIAAVTPTSAMPELVTAFDCVSQENLVPLGRLIVRSGVSGSELAVTQASAPGLTQVLHCDGSHTSLQDSDFGSVMVDAPGVNVCTGEQPSAPARVRILYHAGS